MNLCFISQQDRLLQIKTILSDDALYISDFSGTEALSQLFHFTANIGLQSSEFGNKLQHTLATIIVQKGKVRRYFNGWITQVKQDYCNNQVIPTGYVAYQLTLQPISIQLKTSFSSRIFEKQSVVEIVQSILSAYGYTQINTNKLANTYVPIDFISQYQESDLDFIHRILAKYGINYYFEHSATAHTMVLLDEQSPYDKLGSLQFSATPTGDPDIFYWQSTYALTENKIQHQNTNDDNPQLVLQQQKEFYPEYFKHLPVKDLAISIYPSQFNDAAGMQSENDRQLKYWQRIAAIYQGACATPSLRVGHQFILQGVTHQQENQPYVITALKHQAHDHTHYVKEHVSAFTQQNYHATFTCQAVADGVMPEPIALQNKIHGVQAGVAVGLIDNAPNVQQHAKTQLHRGWDSWHDEQHYPEKRFRIAATNASAGYGLSFYPRSTSEVLLAYNHGDPDQMIVVGGYYNEKNQPPLTPTTLSYHGLIRSKSIGGVSSSQHNDLQFIDVPGKEKIYQHAANQYILGVTQDKASTVGNNMTHKVQGDCQVQSATRIIHCSAGSITINAGIGRMCLMPECILIEAPNVFMDKS